MDEKQYVVTQEQGQAVVNEIKTPKNDYSKYCLSEDEVKRLVAAATNPRDRAMLLLMLHSALRRMEVAFLKVEDIDWERHLIHLSKYKGMKLHPKNSEELTVPISDKCHEYLEMIKKEQTSGWLFVSQHKKRSTHITPEEINHLVEVLGNKAGLTNPIPSKQIKRAKKGNYELYRKINPHLLRHTCIRLYLKNGGDIRMAQKLARHSNIGLTLQTYGCPSLQQRQDEFTKVVRW